MLRDYQRSATVAMINDLQNNNHSLLCLPTAAGKSWIISAFVAYTKIPTLILCPSKEILEQDMDKLSRLVPKDDIGVFSASLGRKDIKMFTFATIGSIFRKPQMFREFKVVIVDECQNVRSDKDDSMYMKLFRANNYSKIFGITATPFLNVSEMEFLGVEDGQRVFQTSSKLQVMCRMDDGFWKDIIYSVTPKEIEALGFTVPVKYLSCALIPDDQLRLKRDGSDFDENYFAYKTRNQESVIVDNITYCSENYRSVLVFCSTIAQANVLSSLVDGSVVVTSKTHPKERAQTISDFKSGRIKVVFNVSCLTVGFDHPSLDCLVMLRPTKSLGLWQQFVGRGVRISPETNKTKCDVIDFAGNHKRLGDASDIRIEKTPQGWDVVSGGMKWHDKEVSSFVVKSSS